VSTGILPRPRVAALRDSAQQGALRSVAAARAAVDRLPGRPVAPWLVLALFVAQLALVVARHEPWFDEAQAWLLARDEPLWSLLAHRMRYEGSPALWHLLLAVPAKLGLPYLSMQVLAAAVAVTGAALLVRYGPFPVPLKALLLFGYVLGYQYVVVARSYVLLAPLLFLIARAYPRKTTHVWHFAIPLLLLANVSVHGLLIAGSIAAVHVLELRKQWQGVAPDVRRRHLRAGAAFGAVVVLVIAQLAPPADVFASAYNVSLLNWLNAAPRILNTAIGGRFLYTGIALALTVWWFGRSGTLLLYALPTLAVLTLSVVKYHNFWHDGVLFLVWIFALWVSFARCPPTHPLGRGAGAPRHPPAALQLARLGALAGLLGVLVVHTWWWSNTVRFDYANAYSGSAALAAYLDDNGLAEGDAQVWAFGFHTLGVQPYFERNVLDNYNDGHLPAYWHWSSESRLREQQETVRRVEPDAIVWGMKFPHQRRLPAFPGYEVDAYFPGALYWKNRVIEQDAFVVLRPE
jgi:uncharacterized integral membrane protein